MEDICKGPCSGFMYLSREFTFGHKGEDSLYLQEKRRKWFDFAEFYKDSKLT